MRRKPRYELHQISGYNIGRFNSRTRKVTTSYSVLDTAYCYREVATFTTRGAGGMTEALRLRRAEELCARLNAEEEADRSKDCGV